MLCRTQIGVGTEGASFVGLLVRFRYRMVCLVRGRALGAFDRHDGR